jgi:tetratricopeptide (TPR) repeat protein
LEQAIRLDPKNAKFYLLQAKVLLDQDKSPEGAKAIFKALELDGDSAPQVLAMSDELYLPDAKEVYGKVIGLGSKEMLPYLGLGNIALHGGDLKEAEKWFTPARGMEQDHPAVLLAWGRLTAAQAKEEKNPEQIKKMFEQARQLLERSKAKGEESHHLYSELAEVYAKLGIWEKAAASYEQALRMRRRRNDLRLALGKAYAQLGRIRDAELKFRQVLVLSPDEADAAKALESIGKRF